MRLSAVVKHVEEFAAPDNRFKNREQVRLWRLTRMRVVKNLISVVGKNIE
ncbi:hypothetical protein Z949_1056 [Sulfitobacter guttiformis KCTC 32187]|nr:hypothetical protein Z949_1056 [Sulfitobacter guttiformis KCTC 32187]